MIGDNSTQPSIKVLKEARGLLYDEHKLRLVGETVAADLPLVQINMKASKRVVPQSEIETYVRSELFSNDQKH